ncbi:Major cardiolipin synthase ClsA [compost metagenome]
MFDSWSKNGSRRASQGPKTNRPPRKTLAVAGALALALSLGYLQGMTTPRATPAIASVPEAGTPGFISQLAAFTSSSATTVQVTGMWELPDEYFAARIEAVRQAKRSIRFETFFMTPGKRADDFAQALIERAKAGVTVQMIVDAAGQSLDDAYWRSLKEAGVDVRFYHPFDARSPLRYNARSHRKILVVDGEVAFTGGVGVSDHWDGTKQDLEPWSDLEIRYEGPAVQATSAVFQQHWAALGGNVTLDEPVKRRDGSPALLSAASPADDESAIRWLYLATIRSAKERLWIASPYFLPGTAERQALVEAKHRGVDVRVLTEGPRNDKRYAYLAMREKYGPLITAGVTIYEYQPSFMHAKAILVDDEWAAFGSANLDPRSFFHNDELQLGVADPTVAARLAGFFDRAILKSKHITQEVWDARPLEERALGTAARMVRFQL